MAKAGLAAGLRMIRCIADPVAMQRVIGRLAYALDHFEPLSISMYLSRPSPNSP
jgi:hypothetical protein